MESEVVGVYNGIIENYQELKEKLLKNGYTFYSQTDTEVLIKLVDYYYIICQIKRDKTFHLRNSKKLLMVFGNLVIF
ncbi:hypothetical protein [Enterococcus faecium]|uniref:hypothetical protein n=1 Tax=Enterococcus faecium TaxID=1352 RepID=UPI003F4336AD